MTGFGNLTTADYRVSRDERRVYFAMQSDESDIWLVRLGQELNRSPTSHVET